VELATALVTHFHPFSNSISLDGNGLDDALDASLAAFTADIEAAVPSYLGIQLTILQNGHPVTLTRITSHRAATASLRIPLTVFGPGFDPHSRTATPFARASNPTATPPGFWEGTEPESDRLRSDFHSRGRR
jgi:hypothetical protein